MKIRCTALLSQPKQTRYIITSRSQRHWARTLARRDSRHETTFCKSDRRAFPGKVPRNIYERTKMYAHTWTQNTPTNKRHREDPPIAYVTYNNRSQHEQASLPNCTLAGRCSIRCGLCRSANRTCCGGRRVCRFGRSIECTRTASSFSMAK